MGAGSAWRHVSPAKRFVLLQLGNFDFICVIYKASSDALKVGLLVFLELWLGTLSLELWLGIRVKHVEFLKLWLVIASLELWLGMADEHEEPLSCGSGWRVLPV